MARPQAAAGRKPRKATEVARRVEQFVARDGGPRGACDVGLKTPGGKKIVARSLNPGLFALERMRAESVRKKRSKVKRKVRSK